MPIVSHRGTSFDHSSVFLSGTTGSGIEARSSLWVRSGVEDVTPIELQKFWESLSFEERKELLRIDKQTLFEQVRKNLYCSRCHGLLVEGYAQITLYGKGQPGGGQSSKGSGGSNGFSSGSSSGRGVNGTHAAMYDDTDDPSVHPWGGLASTRDSMLTLLDCFLRGTPIQVFYSARAREKERESLYPDACGGNGRGWISQTSTGSSGRGHSTKESCALHTARLSCEALVDFWSALGEETRRSLLRMKEEDFIERLMFRFENKRFCRDCRRNVLREFKELKELKRLRKEPRCTPWFCAADTAFRYEVTDRSLYMDWRECFLGDAASLYQRFEWALGSAEGKGDILPFEDVGLSESVHVDGLDLSGRTVCYLTVRGWKRDGRSSELWVKACAVKGQLCVHRRLLVGDGYVSITKGESIQRFFERAEEAEEEEEEEALDKEGNELDGDGLRPQKHAKSPELARDFLLDAATVIFKEQVEKAFREGTARQNAHSIFVCLALSLLEERVRVACKEISALEKQNKLLEEEEDEKREEEERKERRKQKEKERKLRRKEKLKGKEKGKGEEEKGKVVMTEDDEGKAKENGPLSQPMFPPAIPSWPSSGKTSVTGSDDEEDHRNGVLQALKGNDIGVGTEINGYREDRNGEGRVERENHSGHVEEETEKDNHFAEDWERDGADNAQVGQKGSASRTHGRVTLSPNKAIQGKKKNPKDSVEVTKVALVMSRLLAAKGISLPKITPKPSSPANPSSVSVSIRSPSSSSSGIAPTMSHRPGKGPMIPSSTPLSVEQNAFSGQDGKLGAVHNHLSLGTPLGNVLTGKNGVNEGHKVGEKPQGMKRVEECACGKVHSMEGNAKSRSSSLLDLENKVGGISLEGNCSGGSPIRVTALHGSGLETGLVKSGPGPGPGGTGLYKAGLEKSGPGSGSGPGSSTLGNSMQLRGHRGSGISDRALLGVVEKQSDSTTPSIGLHTEQSKTQSRSNPGTPSRALNFSSSAQSVSPGTAVTGLSGPSTGSSTKTEGHFTSQALPTQGQPKQSGRNNSVAWSVSGAVVSAPVLASDWPTPGGSLSGSVTTSGTTSRVVPGSPGLAWQQNVVLSSSSSSVSTLSSSSPSHRPASSSSSSFSTPSTSSGPSSSPSASSSSYFSISTSPFPSSSFSSSSSSSSFSCSPMSSSSSSFSVSVSSASLSSSSASSSSSSSLSLSSSSSTTTIPTTSAPATSAPATSAPATSTSAPATSASASVQSSGVQSGVCRETLDNDTITPAQGGGLIQRRPTQYVMPPAGNMESVHNGCSLRQFLPSGAPSVSAFGTSTSLAMAVDVVGSPPLSASVGAQVSVSSSPPVLRLLESRPIGAGTEQSSAAQRQPERPRTSESGSVGERIANGTQLQSATAKDTFVGPSLLHGPGLSVSTGSSLGPDSSSGFLSSGYNSNTGPSSILREEAPGDSLPPKPREVSLPVSKVSLRTPPGSRPESTTESSSSTHGGQGSANQTVLGHSPTLSLPNSQRCSSQQSPSSSHIQLGGQHIREERANPGLSSIGVQYRNAPSHVAVSVNSLSQGGGPPKTVVHSRVPLPAGTSGQGVLPVPPGHGQIGMSGTGMGPGGMLGSPPLVSVPGLSQVHRPGTHPQSQGQPGGFYQNRSGPQWVPRGRNGMLPIPTGGGGPYMNPAGNGRLGGMASQGLPIGGLRHSHPVHIQDGSISGVGVGRSPVVSSSISQQMPPPGESVVGRQAVARSSGDGLVTTTQGTVHSLSSQVPMSGPDGGVMAMGLPRPVLPFAASAPRPLNSSSSSSSSTPLSVDLTSDKCKGPSHDPFSFSLFHFGGPAPVPPLVVTGPTACGVGGGEGLSDGSPMRTGGQGRGMYEPNLDEVGAARSRVIVREEGDVSIGEYSLFSSGAGKSFGFF